MAVPARILIDTNVIINLEDNKEIGKRYADLTRICNQYGIALLVHVSSQDDVARDNDEARKKISLSKLAKYPKIHKTPATTAEKAAAYGPIKSANDEVDTDLLVSLNLNIADLLVTEDRDLAGRVKGTALEGRVLNLSDAVASLQAIFGSVSNDFRHVRDGYCNQYKPDDPFFASLAGDYPGFAAWYAGCMAKQRECWVIQQQGGIGGMIIHKPESTANAAEKKELGELGVPGDKILKLCLFKVDENVRGEKFGEQLLKKAMDHAHRNGFDATYLTVFTKHPKLIELIQKFGFQRCGTKGTGAAEEEVYFKYTKVTGVNPEPTGFDFHRMFWPCIKAGKAEKYLIPVMPEFHDRLFPEGAKIFAPTQMKLFEDTLPKTPGNAIRKAYVCNAMTTSIPPGSVLLFYRSKDSVITSVGVLESYNVANDLEELTAFVGNRSVYTQPELAGKTDGRTKAKAVNFYYARDLKKPITLADLEAAGLAVPQSIAQIDEASFRKLYDLMDKEDREIFYD